MDHQYEATVDPVMYWIDGGGHWMNRWHCTDGDLLLCILSIFLMVVMIGQYAFYAFQSEIATENIKETTFVKHLKHLRNVFLVCGFIHILTHIVAWWLPLYWIINVVVAVNIIQMQFLIMRKRDVIVIQRHIQGEDAILIIEDALHAIHETKKRATLEGVETSLVELERILSRGGA